MYITSRNRTVFYDSILTSNLFQILHVEENLCNVLGESAWGGVNEDRFMAILKWHYFLRTVFLLLLFNFSFVSFVLFSAGVPVLVVFALVYVTSSRKTENEKRQPDCHYNEQKFRLHHMMSILFDDSSPM